MTSLPSPPPDPALHERRILFVGGKGGVGKTTTAGALGLASAEAGKRVLLVSTDPAHSLADLFGTAIGDRIRSLAPGLDGLEIDPERQVDAYLSEVRKNLKAFVRPPMFPEIERQIELTRHSPGAVEAALLDRMAELMDERSGAERLPAQYDQIIFDTAPTGHTLRLLSLPEVMQAWTDGLLRSRDRSEAFGRALDRLGKRSVPPEGAGGDRAEADMGKGEESGAGSREEGRGDDLSWFDTPDTGPIDARGRRIREILLARRRKFTRARRTLLDRSTTAFVLVLVPERLPILESRKALDALARHGVPVAGMVVNRVLPDEVGGEFLELRRAQEARYLERIEDEFRALPRIRVPLLARDVEGLPALREVGGYLRPWMGQEGG